MSFAVRIHAVAEDRRTLGDQRGIGAEGARRTEIMAISERVASSAAAAALDDAA